MIVAVLGYGRRGWVKNDLLNSNWFMIGLVLDTEDSHEGCRAFLEKRKAAFTGR